jgi:hypothetical protein
MVVPSPVRAGRALPGWMVHTPSQPGMLKLMVSGPGLLLARTMASRSEQSPSLHEPSFSSTTVSTV